MESLPLRPFDTPLLRRPAVARLLLIALFAEIGYAVLNISAMPVYLKFDRGYGAGVIGLVMVAYLVSEAAFKGPMGALADRMGRKRLIVVGPGLSVVTALATLAVPHEIGAWETILLMALRVLDGLGAAMLWPAAFALMGDTVGDGERQRSMSLLNVCYLAGVGLALPLGGVVNDLSGSRSASLYLAAILFAAVALAAYRVLPSGRKLRDGASEMRRDRPRAETDWRESWQRIPGLLALAFVVFVGIGLPLTVVKLFAEQQFGLSESAFGLLAMPAVGAMAFLGGPIARLGERIGRARAVHWGLGLCALGLTVAAAGGLVPAMRSAWALALGGVPLAFGFMLAIPAWYACVSDLNPARRAANIGAVMTAQGFGAIVGAPLGAFLYERMQHYGADFGRYAPFMGCCICIAAGWVLSLRVLSGNRDDEAA
jgi:DHA1 family multidrug resistance protein-like MFS transporter